MLQPLRLLKILVVKTVLGLELTAYQMPFFKHCNVIKKTNPLQCDKLTSLAHAGVLQVSAAALLVLLQRAPLLVAPPAKLTFVRLLH